MIKRILKISITAFLLYSLLSCASKIEQRINDEKNVTVKLLKIRDLTYSQRYKLAEKLYKKVHEENLDNPVLIAELDYEIAYLYVKQKKFKEARPLFEDLINKYELSKDRAELPQWPYYLSLKVLNDIVIPEIEKPNFWQRIKIAFTPKKKRPEQTKKLPRNLQ